MSEIKGSAGFGVSPTVTSTRAIVFSLDGNPNVHGTEGEFKVVGDAEYTGDLDVGGMNGSLSASMDAAGE